MNDWEDHSGKVLGQAVRLSNWRPKPAYSREQYLQLGKKLSLYPTALTRTRTASYSSLLLEIESTIARFLLDYSLRG
ncbi:hypothetical protein FRX31_032851 [Thalictrum thalictroides]|uniref:Uncharacterized protein n=1 Tax=Thalictrum thalictroides TaxID=46969 RepID=A0A7J6UYQ8_THATH|nr:hypothetical protein FRX31_032851 [Thalictrum thalictroides]